MTWMRRTITLGAAISLAVPAGASAATVDLAYNQLHYVAALGEANDVTITQVDPLAVVVTDANAPVTAGKGCVAVDTSSARCTPDSAGPVYAWVDSGDGNDIIRAFGVGLSAHAGGGDDRVTGGQAANVLYGGPGDDQLTGGAGADYLVGGRGRDVLVGKDGTDYLYGGPGRDWLDGGAGNDSLFSGTAHCGEGDSDAAEPTSGSYVAPDCEITRFALAEDRDGNSQGAETYAYPERRGHAAVVFHMYCPYWDDNDGAYGPVPFRGRVRLTRNGRLMGTGVVHVPACIWADLEGSPPWYIPHADVRVLLTARGQQLVRRRPAARITVRFSGRNVPPIPWRISLGSAAAGVTVR